MRVPSTAVGWKRYMDGQSAVRRLWSMWVPHLWQIQSGLDGRAKGTYHESSILETDAVNGRSPVAEGRLNTCPSGGKLS